MKKYILFKLVFIISFTINITASAQVNKLLLGVKGGVNLSNMNGNFFKDKSWIAGFNAGLRIDYLLTERLYIRSGLELTNKGVKEDRIETINENKGTIDATTRLLYLQIPVHAAYKLNLNQTTKLVLYGGPFLAYGINGKRKTEITSEKPSEELNKYKIDFFGEKGFAKRLDMGLGGGIGLEYQNFGIETGYDFGLINIIEDITMIGENGTTPLNIKAKTMNAYASLTYRF